MCSTTTHKVLILPNIDDLLPIILSVKYLKFTIVNIDTIIIIIPCFLLSYIL